MGYNDAGHPCPITVCGLRIPHNKLMCRPHWAMVPASLQRAVYAAWAGGLGAGSKVHRDAVQAAIDAVKAKLAVRDG